MWVANIWCRTMGSANPDTFTIFHRWGLCLTIIGKLFTQGRNLSLLVNTQHIFSLPFYSTVRLCWTLSHLTESTQSNTKRNVDLLTMHSHPFNAMSPCICNARCHCMLYHVICTMNATWTILLMHVTNASWTILSIYI